MACSCSHSSLNQFEYDIWFVDKDDTKRSCSFLPPRKSLELDFNTHTHNSPCCISTDEVSIARSSKKHGFRFSNQQLPAAPIPASLGENPRLHASLWEERRWSHHGAHAFARGAPGRACALGWDGEALGCRPGRGSRCGHEMEEMNRMEMGISMGYSIWYLLISNISEPGNWDGDNFICIENGILWTGEYAFLFVGLRLTLPPPGPRVGQRRLLQQTSNRWVLEALQGEGLPALRGDDRKRPALWLFSQIFPALVFVQDWLGPRWIIRVEWRLPYLWRPMVPQLACAASIQTTKPKGPCHRPLARRPVESQHFQPRTTGIWRLSAVDALAGTRFVSCRDRGDLVETCWSQSLLAEDIRLIPYLSNGVHCFMIFHDLLFKPGPGFGIGWDLWPGATSLAGYIGIPVKSIQILVWWAHLHVQLVLGDASQLVGHQSPTYYLGIFQYNLNKEEMGIISITKIYLGICWVLYRI